MNKNLASSLNHGDIVINFFGEECVVESKRIVFGDYDMSQVFITLIDTQLTKSEYLAEDIYYPDLSGESDEEKNWVRFASKNKTYINTFDDISDIKYIFIQGFISGFNHKQRYSAEEQLQK